MRTINCNQFFDHISKIATVGILGWTAALLTIIVIAGFGYSFINPALNALFSYSVFLYPTVLFIFFAGCRLRKVLKIIACGLLLPVSLIMLVGLLMTGPDIASILRYGVDQSNQFVRSIPLGTSRIAVYRTNGGATTDFGVHVVQQRFTCPGIKHSVGKCYEYGAFDAELEPIDNVRLRCHIRHTFGNPTLQDSIIADQ